MTSPADLYRRFLLELWHADDTDVDRIAGELATVASTCSGSPTVGLRS